MAGAGAPSAAGGSGVGTDGPVVTVLIPVYNGARTLVDSIRSVGEQNYPALELLLLDDGSTDASPQISRESAAKDSRIRVESNGGNLGLAATLNRGFALARGRFVLVLHQDCVLQGSDWVTKALRSFEDPRVIGVSGTARHDVGAMGLREREFWIIRQHIAFEPADAGAGSVDRPLFSENKCDVFRRVEIQNLGGFDERLKEGGEDQVLAWRLRSTHWRMEFRSDLPYIISLGQGEQLAPHLRREISYGRQMRQILGITGLGAIHRAPGGRADPRLKNRIVGVVWIPISIAGVIALVLTQQAWLTLVVVAPPLIRWVQFCARASRVRSEYRLRGRDIVATATVGLVADLAYAIGTISPSRRGTAGPARESEPHNAPPS